MRTVRSFQGDEGAEAKLLCAGFRLRCVLHTFFRSSVLRNTRQYQRQLRLQDIHDVPGSTLLVV